MPVVALPRGGRGLEGAEHGYTRTGGSFPESCKFVYLDEGVVNVTMIVAMIHPITLKICVFHV